MPPSATGLSTSPAATAPDATAAPSGRWALTWAALNRKHPEYLADYWQECRALTTGGRKLLADEAIMLRLFPRHTDETEAVYRERRKRAFFIPYPGEIVGDLVAQLAQDPVRVTGDPKPEEFYTETFFEDMDRRGMNLTAYVQSRVREALVVRTAWTLVDLPPRPGSPEEVGEEEGRRIESLKDEEDAGLLRAYVVPLEAECVTDWEEDDEGELVWVCIHRRLHRRAMPGVTPRCVDRFTYYTEAEWAVFEVAYDEEKPPKETDVFTPVRTGTHSFGDVPVVRLQVPDGLWALDKLHAIAKAHFNQRNAFSWSQFKHLFPLLTAYLGPEVGSGGEVPSEAQADPGRATAQVYGTGRVHVFGSKDRLEYTSPDASVFATAAGDLKDLRDEMHRVTSTMASTIDNTPSAVGRSGESKAQDKSSREVVLAAIGTLAVEHLRELLTLVAQGRGDTNASARSWVVMGLREFDSVSASEAVADAQVVEGLTIPSPTFWRLYRANLAARILRSETDPATLDKIRKEIEANTPAEDFDPANRPDPNAPPGPRRAPPEEGGAGGRAVEPGGGSKKPAPSGGNGPGASNVGA